MGWGSNSFGQLGLPLEKIKYISTPTVIFSNEALQIKAGLRHSVIIDTKGIVFTSGYGRKGQLGLCFNNSIPVKIDKFTKGTALNKNHNNNFILQMCYN